MDRKFDVVVVGGGPAGLTAALYAARGGKSVALLEKGAIGGQVATTSEIHNYPGLYDVSGFDLAQKMLQQAEIFGVKVLYEEARALDLAAKTVETKKGKILANSIILCMGAAPKKLGAEGESEFLGRGVSYCATCDGAFFKGEDVCIVGGGDSAVTYALYMLPIAKKVYLINRSDRLRAGEVLSAAVQKSAVEILFNTEIVELLGDKRLTSLRLKNRLTSQTTTLPTSALFIAIGHEPATELVKGQLALDDHGYIITNPDMSVPSHSGIFAAGDIRQKPLRQIVTAVSDGAISAENLKR